jgi:diguanylate cyclase (GGDEF)-like protein
MKPTRSEPVIPTLRRRLTGYPAHVWTLAVLFLAGALGCTSAALMPMSPTAPRALHASTAVVAVLLAVAVLARGRRLSLSGALVVLLISITISSVLVANSSTTGGAVLGASVFLWQAIYAAFFFSRRTAWGVLLFEVASLGIALLITGLPGLFTPWVAKSLSFVAAVEVHSRIVERLRRRADTDSLTGLANRGALVRAAERELARVERTGTRLALAVLDLDGFKAVNDTHGHAAGDALLVSIAETWSSLLRPTDVLARHGGDEFVLLLPDAGVEETRALLRRLRDSVEIAWSYGIATCKPGDTLDRLLARADARLYAAKARRGSVSAPTPVADSPAGSVAV